MNYSITIAEHWPSGPSRVEHSDWTYVLVARESIDNPEEHSPNTATGLIVL